MRLRTLHRRPTEKVRINETEEHLASTLMRPKREYEGFLMDLKSSVVG